MRDAIADSLSGVVAKLPKETFSKSIGSPSGTNLRVVCVINVATDCA